MSPKQSFVRELVPGNPVSDLFVITEARQLTSRNGPYWNLTLSDATGRVDAKIWSPASQEYEGLAAGMIVEVDGQVESFRDRPQVVVRRLREVQDDLGHADLAGLLPVSAVPPEQLLEELEDLLREHLSHKPWKSFVFKVLDDEDIRARLLAAPGAKAIHHAYAGGLLEHTLAVVRICLGLCDVYPGLDREVLLVGAALHDLGKAWELTGGFANDYSDEGRLLGHIQMGVEVIEPFLKRVKSLEPELGVHLKHLMLSHHGEYAFGSPRRPKTAEALALHFADQIDSKLNTAAGAFDPDAPEGSWSPFVRSLERFLYKPRPTPNTGRAARRREKEPTQCLLPLKE